VPHQPPLSSPSPKLTIDQAMFLKIEVIAVLGGNRDIFYSKTAPKGYSYREYSEVADQAARAFGPHNCRVIGTWLPGVR